MKSVGWLLLGSIIGFVTVYGQVDVTTYELDCQPPTRYARVLHAQDLSSDMTPYYNDAQIGGGVAYFDQWLHYVFEDGASTGILTFDDKQQYTGPNGVCADTWRDLSVSPILPDYSTLPMGSGNLVDRRSVLDVLYRSAQFGWDNPQPEGRRISIVYAGAESRLPPSGLAPFDNSINCEAVDYPTVGAVQLALAGSNVYTIFVVPENLVDAYKNLFATNVVVTLTRDPLTFFENLFNAFNLIYCGTEIPTQEPQGSSPTFVFTDPTDPPTTAPPTCTENAILQMVHIQDVSHSYTNDLGNMLGKFPTLFNSIDAQFYSKQVALTSFSDKPTGNSGYYLDYCYREDLVFTNNESDFMDATDTLEILSGRDWKESQYDALYESASSGSIGWEAQDIVDGRVVVRVAIIATDAGPHVQGDLASELPVNGATCFDRDYPLPSELGATLDTAGVFPIFIVTSDIYWHWKNVWAPALGTDKVTVLELSSDSDVLFQAILDALTDICNAQRRALAA